MLKSMLLNKRSHDVDKAYKPNKMYAEQAF